MKFDLNQNFKIYIRKSIKKMKIFFDDEMQMQALYFFGNTEVPIERKLNYLTNFVEQDIDFIENDDRRILSHIDCKDYFLIFISKNNEKENVFAIKKDQFMFSNVFFYLEKYTKEIDYLNARTFNFLIDLINS